MRYDIALFRVRLGKHRFKRCAALGRAITRIFVNMERPEAVWAMISRGVAERRDLSAAMLTDKSAVVLWKSLCLHISTSAVPHCITVYMIYAAARFVNLFSDMSAAQDICRLAGKTDWLAKNLPLHNFHFVIYALDQNIGRLPLYGYKNKRKRKINGSLIISSVLLYKCLVTSSLPLFICNFLLI